MAEVRNEQSTRDLVSQLTRDMGDLVRQEVDLAKTETSEKLTQLVIGLVLLLVGLLTAFAALIILLDAGVYANLMVPPATPKGLNLLRISLSAAHTREQIDTMIEAFGQLRQAA